MTGTIYVLVALVSSLLVDYKVLEGSNGPLLEVVKAGGIEFPHKPFALIAPFAVTNSALINIMMASRLCYSMANERILPRGMGRVLRRRRRTPGTRRPHGPDPRQPPGRPPGGRDIRAGVLLAIGVALWAVNKAVLRARAEA